MTPIPPEEGKKMTFDELLATMNRAQRRKFVKNFEKQAKTMKCKNPTCSNYRAQGKTRCKVCDEKKRSGII